MVTLKKPQSISPSEMTKELVVSKCDYFVDVQLWPQKSIINPELWLSNFLPAEMVYAIHLLNSFLFYSEQLVNPMFIAAFQMLSNEIRCAGDSFISTLVSWNSFIDNIIVTPVTGEDPNISDSGFVFARKARQQLGIKEAQLMSQEKALQLLVDKGPRPVIFVDDFVGSGDQFLKTWTRDVRINSTNITYKDLSSGRGFCFYYCPLVCTEYGYNRLKVACPDVTLRPVHTLSSCYSALAPDSIIWPPNLLNTATNFIFEASKRAGIPDNGGGVNDWRGYNKLGLTIAFTHSVPDATLPIFYWNKNGWKPLIKRT